MFDKDGNNVITEDELKQMFHGAFQSEQPEKQEQLWHEIMMEVDNNGDGQISYEEFYEQMILVL